MQPREALFKGSLARADATATMTKHWPLSQQDPEALDLLRSRIANAARQERTLLYAELFDGVSFNLPAPYPQTVSTPWSPSDIVVVNDFLGRISDESYDKDRVMASAIVVNETGMPGGGFFKLAKQLGALRGVDRDTFFLEQQRAVFAHYKR